MDILLSAGPALPPKTCKTQNVLTIILFYRREKIKKIFCFLVFLYKIITIKLIKIPDLTKKACIYLKLQFEFEYILIC